MRPLTIAMIFAIPTIASAQVYSWKDANGKVHYTDQPPAQSNIKARKLSSGAVTPPDSASSDVKGTATKSDSDKRLDAKEKAKDEQEKAAKAEKQKQDDARRAQECDRARLNLQGIEAGKIRFRLNANGEQEALDGSVRDAELATAQQYVQDACSPKPAAAASESGKDPGKGPKQGEGKN